MSKIDLSLSHMNRRKLLKLRLCDLPITLDIPWFVWARGVVEKQLRKRQLVVRPHYWISDEWFCPDGVPGVAVPFFLLHPRLVELEQEMMGFVDGGTPLKRLKILQHETGHVVDNAYRLRLKGGAYRRHLFGDPSTTYPESYEPKLYSRSYVRHLGEAYAQSHPDEDFAETFAVWLQRKAQWRRRYKNTKALKKLEYINALMKSLENQTPDLKNTRRVDPLEKNILTLREYYIQKRHKYGVAQKKVRPDRFLLHMRQAIKTDVNSTKNRSVALHSLLQRHRLDVLRETSSELKTPKYKIEPLFELYLKAAHQKDWTLPVGSGTQVRDQLKISFLGEARQYLSDGGGRVWL